MRMSYRYRGEIVFNWVQFGGGRVVVVMLEQASLICCIKEVENNTALLPIIAGYQLPPDKIQRDITYQIVPSKSNK